MTFEQWVIDNLKGNYLTHESRAEDSEWFSPGFHKNFMIDIFDKFEREIIKECDISDCFEYFCISDFLSMREIKLWMIDKAIFSILSDEQL
jgi:hypothetical protein